jgi:serine/threonine-protein kinase
MDERLFADRFRAVERLDRGGSAETYRAVDEAGGVYTVDVLHPADAAETGQLSEAMHAVAALAHPNIPRVYEWGTDDTGFYVIREYVDGWDLTTLLSRGPLDDLRVARYGAEAALGLAAAHGAGVLHGSLHTSDVMVTPEGAVKVLGLGQTLPRMLQPGGPPANAHFLAPEQLRGETPLPGTDVWALGIVLYEAATSSVPFEADTAGGVASLVLESEPEPARRINPNVPASLEVVVMHALRKDPRERYTSIDEMRQDLDRVADQIQSGIAAEAGLGRTRKKWPWWVWAIIGVVAFTLLAGAATGGYIWWRRNMTRVPALVGLTPDAARTKIAAAGLVPGDVGYTTTVTAGLPEGVIETQSPVPGGWVRVGTRLSVLINGPEKVKVPAIVGTTQASAITTIQAEGLTIAAINNAFDKAAAGTVISQTPTAGAEVAKGAGVTFTVSKGPQVGTVPSVVGQAQAAAQATLTQAGFKSTVSNQYSDTIAVGTVLAQSPTAGSNSSVGVTVALVISQGPQPVTVPSVVGKSLSSAVSLVQSVGLKVALATHTVGSTVNSGTVNPAIGIVYSQSPSAGASAKAGDTVSITYNQP